MEYFQTTWNFPLSLVIPDARRPMCGRGRFALVEVEAGVAFVRGKRMVVGSLACFDPRHAALTVADSLWLPVLVSMTLAVIGRVVWIRWQGQPRR
jgi:hypothetical protein